MCSKFFANRTVKTGFCGFFMVLAWILAPKWSKLQNVSGGKFRVTCGDHFDPMVDNRDLPGFPGNRD